MEIIPAIDLIDNKCVRLSKGDYAKQTQYSANPLEMAKKFESSGCKRLHLVDLDGAKTGVPRHFHVLEEIAKNTSLEIDYSGGLREKEHIEKSFQAGATFVGLGSLAVKQVDLVKEWIREFGASKIILSADVKGEEVAVQGWQESSGMSLEDFVRSYEEVSFCYLVCTDISCDGMLQGSNNELYRSVIAKFPKLSVIASGGVSSMTDLQALKETGVVGTIVGKALYEGHITFRQLEEYNSAL